MAGGRSGPFRVDASIEGEVGVATVVGDLDMLSSDEFLETLKTLLAEGVISVTIDLTQVGFVDSTGLGAILTMRRAVPERDVVIKGASPATRRLFGLTGVDQLVDLRS